MKTPTSFTMDQLVGDANSLIEKYRTLIAVVLIVLGVTILWNNFADILYWILPERLADMVNAISYRLPQMIIAAAIIGIGLYILADKKKKAGSGRRRLKKTNIIGNHTGPYQQPNIPPKTQKQQSHMLPPPRFLLILQKMLLKRILPKAVLLIPLFLNPTLLPESKASCLNKGQDALLLFSFSYMPDAYSYIHSFFKIRAVIVRAGNPASLSLLIYHPYIKTFCIVVYICDLYFFSCQDTEIFPGKLRRLINAESPGRCPDFSLLFRKHWTGTAGSL